MMRFSSEVDNSIKCLLESSNYFHGINEHEIGEKYNEVVDKLDDLNKLLKEHETKNVEKFMV